MHRLFKAAAAAVLSMVVLAPAMEPASAAPQTGMASYYKSGKVTANGERFNPHGLTAAHRTLPFGTKVKVVNMLSGKSVVVRINDRGPFIRGRIIDLSLGAAQKIGLHRSGVAKVKVQVLN
jgi:rare lipoprotein A